MQIFFEKKNNTVIIKLQGELDHHAASCVKENIDQYITTNNVKNYILDLTYLNFMDSSGIGVIIGRYKNIKAFEGNISIVCEKTQIVKILNMSGIDKIIPIYPNADYALKKWEGK